MLNLAAYSLQMPVRELVRAWIAIPDVAFIFLAFGAIALLFGFIRPGMVVPAVLGAFALTLGAWAFAVHGVPVSAIHWIVAVSAGLPVAVALVLAVYIALRARRNKTDFTRSFQVR